MLEGYSPLQTSRLDDRVLTEVASSHGVTAAQVVLRWHLQHGIVVIPKSVHVERIRENLDLFGFALDANEMGHVDALARG